MSLSALERALLEHPFSKGMCQKHVKILSDCARFTQFDEGQVLFREGEVANRFYLIQRGKVTIETQMGDAGVYGIQTLGAGDVLGWSWLFPPYYWHFDARAEEPTLAVAFFGTRLREHSEENHEFGHELMKRVALVLIQRLQSTRRHFLRLKPETGLYQI